MSVFFGVLYCLGLTLPLVAGLVLGNHLLVLIFGAILIASAVLIYIFGGGRSNTAKSIGLEAIAVGFPFCVGILYLIIAGIMWCVSGELYV